MTEKMILYGKHLCRRCNCLRILVRSRKGGFVTQNCVRCEKPQSVHVADLPDLYCGECDEKLEKFQRQNYFYYCEKCAREWELAALIPHWDELFEYYGYEIPPGNEHVYIESRIKVPLSASYSV